MKTEINFLACEHLDFSDNYISEKTLINTKFGNKICWKRPVIGSEYPVLVQFCKKRGRLNSPESCLCQYNKICNDYNDYNHTVYYESE